VATIVVLQLWRARLRVPFYDQFDVSLNAGQIKTALTHGWYFDNAKLGYPTGQNLRDFPLGDGWHFVFFRLFSFVSRDWAAAMNVFYLGSFVVIAAAAFAALRLLQVRPAIAAAGAIVTTLLPYHFARNEMHVFLSEYSAIPLVVALGVAQLTDQPWLRLRGGRTPWYTVAGALAICAWAGGTGTYYAVFSALLLALTAAVTSIARRRTEPVLSGLLLAGVVVLVLGIQLLPTLLKDARHGRDHAFDRSAQESDLYSLRPVMLFTPIPNHRISALGEPTRKYRREPNPSEPQSLGLVSTIGLIGLLGVGLSPIVGGRGLRDPTDRGLALFALVALVLGISAGFGMVLALAGFTEIRGWARLAVVLGFVGVAAAARALDRLMTNRKASQVAVIGVVVLCTTVAILDQTSGADIPPYRRGATTFDIERNFVDNISGKLGKDAAILQLPYVPYPEEPPQARMVDYSHLAGFLHSDSLRWSYGAVRGRPTWQAGQLGLPLVDQLRRARDAGFTGVWVDRFGYADGGAQIERQLAACVGAPIVTETDQRRVLYDLRAAPRC
jgi:phosphoglycerol transferase